MIAAVASAGLLLFAGMPRLGSNQLITGAMASVHIPVGVRGQTVTPLFHFVALSANGSSGFSPTMDLAFRGRPSNETVMYVRSQLRSYWRALTFDRYDSRQWQSTQASSSQRRGGSGGFDLALTGSAAGVQL